MSDERRPRGAAVTVEGRLQTRTWAAADGSSRRATEIVASAVSRGLIRLAGPLSVLLGRRADCNEDIYALVLFLRAEGEPPFVGARDFEARGVWAFFGASSLA